VRRAALLCSALAWLVAVWWLVRPMPAAHPDRIAPLFELIDLDGDGWVRLQEAAQVGGPDLDFEALDLDGDGRLGPGEVEASVWVLDPAWWVEGPD